MYVIFYNNKPIYLSDTAENSSHYKSFDFNSIDVLDILIKIKKGHLDGCVLTGKSSDKLFQDFINNFDVIEAAGGLVYNEKKELLFIFRNGVWDLPKGKIEKNETIEKAALREVAEECGVTDLQLGKFIDKTYHIYEHKNNFIFKLTYWFEMSCDDKILTPQLEEGITKAVFLDKSEQVKALQNTYHNIKNLLNNNIKF